MNATAVPIEEFCETGSGSTPLRSVSEYYGGGIPWVKSGELKDGVISSTAESVSKKRAQAARLKLIPKGSVLVAMYGATVGRTALLDIDATTNQAICHIRPDPTRAIVQYVWHALKAKLPELLAKRVGGAQPNISQETIRTTKIPLPPLPEQRRIADILDKADAIRRKRKQAIALTEELLRSTFLELFGDPVTNPKGWPVEPLGKLADIASGVAKGKKYGDQAMVTLPYMRVANVQDGHLALDEIKTITVAEDDGRRYRLEHGDVLLTEGGDPDKLGRGAVWRNQIPNCIHQNHIFRVRPIQGISSEYLSAIIGSERGKRYFLRAAKQTTGIASINMAQLRAFPVLVPPSRMQAQYKIFVARMAHLRARQDESSRSSDQLFAALVQRAFSGDISA